MPLPLFAALVVACLAVANDLNWHSPLLGAIVGSVYLLSLIYWHGQTWAGGTDRAWRWVVGSLAALVWLAGVGAVVYILIGLPAGVVYALLIGWPIGAAWLKRIDSPPGLKFIQWLSRLTWWLNTRQNFRSAIPRARAWCQSHLGSAIGLGAWAMSVILTWVVLLTHQSTASINSLWVALPWYWLALYVVSLILALWLWSQELPPWLNALLGWFTVGGIATVAVVAYRVGYGFDPFIHRATELVIWRDGEILPKTPYYLGQYSAVIMIARLFGASVDLVDRWLVPVVATIVLPITAMATARTLTQHLTFDWGGRLRTMTANWWYAAIPILLVFIDQLIVTTPQTLANLWALVVIALVYVGLAQRAAPRWWLVPAAGSVVVILIHPLTGIPLCLFVLLSAWWVGPTKKLIRYIGSVLLAVAGALSLLAAFGLQAWLLPQVDTNIVTPVWNWPTIDQWQTWWPEQTFHLVADVAAAARWWPLVAMLLLVIGGARILKSRAYPAGLWAGVVLINAILTASVVHFAAVINYEQSAYAARIAATAMLYLWPLAAVGLVGFISIIPPRPRSLCVGGALLISLLISVQFYQTLPHHDAQTIGHAYSTGAAEVATVESIEARAEHLPYVVLANQSVAAAAMQEFGFRYYPTPAGQLYFYPIPTASPLYQLYLRALTNPADRELIQIAMDTVGVQRAYLVINHYWTDAKELIIAAQTAADDWWTVNEQVTVFEYR